ncbi:hypothetical protein IFM89_025830, partial [Coptis chinensis]
IVIAFGLSVLSEQSRWTRNQRGAANGIAIWRDVSLRGLGLAIGGFLFVRETVAESILPGGGVAKGE